MRQEEFFSHSLCDNGVNENFARLVLNDANIVKPILKERFLKDFILGIGDADEAFNMFCGAFSVEKQLPVRMILIKPSGSHSYDDLLYIKNTSDKCIGEDNIILSTSIYDSVLMVTSIVDNSEIYKLLQRMVYIVQECCDLDVFAVYSLTIEIQEMPEMFKRLRAGTENSFYSESVKVVCETDVHINADTAMLTPQYTGIEKAVSSGNEQKTDVLLDEFFSELRRCMPTPAVAKTYCLELYVCIIRCCEVGKIDTYMKGIVSIQQEDSLSKIEDFIRSKAVEIVVANTPKTVNVYSSLIKDTIRIIDENIGNEKLSLRWIASTILYTNVDYLGKIFKKETGMNFSHYVMEKRMELAKELIMGGKKDRIYEVAEKVGYGSNSQYFSQVFKKYTGISPLEYKEMSRVTTQKK